MKILMIGFNDIILRQGRDAGGDTWERHIKYAQALRNKYPEGGVTMFVRNSSNNKLEIHKLSESLTVIAVPARRALYPIKVFFVIRDLLKQEKYDLITTQTPFDDGIVGFLVKKFYGISFNVQIYSSFLDVSAWIAERPVIYRVFNVIGKIITQKADTVRVVCIGEKERLERRYPNLLGKIIVLHPHIHGVFDQGVRVEREIANELEAPIMLFVGRFVDQKNLSLLLNAVAILGNRSNPFKAVMIGEGNLKNELQALSSVLRIDHLIEWVGNQPQEFLVDYYAGARVSVLSSFHEGFGRVIVESYLQGVPMVVTPFVSAPELIEHENTGLICQAFDDPNELADKIAALLFSPDKAKAMGEAGRQHVKEYLLSENEYLNAMIKVWEKTVAGNLVN